MDHSTIMAVLVDKRTDAAPEVQKILTDYGCFIKTRLGMHESSTCADEGMIILDLTAADEKVKELKDELTNIEGVKVKSMKLDF
ncbi:MULTISPECIES: hypothetical protein [unclassified Halanaerobium]|uniref:hypothetical protein n=1 Tax=unclassified Halanaerobium TaxID=2641197 RepID=UPI000DF34F4D|nr:MULTISPECIES: hypothetical protein [unclassified Halanaerobium]RCW40662.1 hypothetical protein DFR78_1439 [Halanaerobium sp. MA284_MarDTE_T2]RCW78784.1 hypothetical protein DER71_14710 [Halanaerobium sp. DL-01]